MNQRVIKITTSINNLAISDNEKLTQGDKNTHFIDIKFLDDINLIGYQLLVLYKLPFPDETVLVDTYNSLQTEMKLLIPNRALIKSGELTVEFALKKEKELITINKNLTLEVISTINAAYIENIELGDTTKKTITEQLEKLTTLLAQAQVEIDRYDENVTNKTNEFDKHVEVSKTEINDYIEAKKPELKGADGKDGAPGKNGVDGEDGATYTPSVDSEGNLSWTNDKNLPNPPTVNIKGPAGEGGGGEGVDPSTLLEKGNVPAIFNNAEAIVKALQSNAGMKFDENLLYLNDAGTKKVGFCYLDRLIDGIFECIKQTTVVVNDSSCFKNFSNKENSDKLSNLIECFETYDSASAACLGGEPYKTIQIKGKTKYIGFTKDLDTPKASMIHYKIDGEEYALRRYKGKTNYDSYMPKTYPDTYKTMTECPELPDTSDATSVWCFFKSCNKMEYPPAIDTRNCQSVSQAYNGLWSAKELPFIKTGRCTDFSYLYNCYGSPFFDNKRKFPFLETGNGTNFTEMYSYNNVKDTEFPAIDTSNGTIFIGMYRSCKSTQEFPQLNTSKGKDFRYMYEYCEKAIKVSDIDLSSISAEDITTNKKLERMLYRCDALPSVTFNNVPVGITLEQMRTTTSAPSTCEIILNHRSE